jgi:hypothetical protein
MKLCRRDLLVALSASLLCRCSDARFSAVGAASKALWSDINGRTVTWEEAEKVPYASLGVRVGDQSERLAVLAQDQAGTLSWSVGRNTTLLTRGGRIVGWYDGNPVMTQLADGQDDPIEHPATLAVPPETCIRQLDFPEDRRYGVVVRSKFADAGTRMLAGPAGSRAARHWLELSQSNSLDWSFRNEFDRDETSGVVLASRQSVHPALAPIAFRVLRAYAAPRPSPASPA